VIEVSSSRILSEEIITEESFNAWESGGEEEQDEMLVDHKYPQLIMKHVCQVVLT